MDTKSPLSCGRAKLSNGGGTDLLHLQGVRVLHGDGTGPGHQEAGGDQVVGASGVAQPDVHGVHQLRGVRVGPGAAAPEQHHDLIRGPAT